MAKTTTLLTMLCLSACFSEAEQLDAESEASSDDTAGSTTGSTSSDPSAAASSSSSSASDPTAEDSSTSNATETDGSSSSGENTQGALLFDGNDEATSAPIAQASLPAEFTVELWVEITEEPYFGFLIDTRDAENTEGWVLLVDPPWWTNRLILNWIAEDGSVGHGLSGPEIDTLAPGWHHWAFTRDSDGLVQCWVDGVALAEGPSELPPASLIAPIIIGRYPAEDPRSDLWWRGAAIDDIHISNVARYTEAFVPKSVETDDSSVLFWDFDEGDGEVAVDQVSGIELELSSPAWVEGH